MHENDEACRRCIQKGIECVRRKKDLQSLLDEQSDWRTDMEREMRALRSSLDQVSTTLAQLARQRPAPEEPPRKRQAVQAENIRNAPDDSDLATEGLLGLAGQWPTPSQGSSRIERNIVNEPRSRADISLNNPLAEPTLLTSPERSESPGVTSSSIRGDVLHQGILTLDEAVELFYLYFRMLDPHICHLIGPIHGIQDLPEKDSTYGLVVSSPLQRMLLLAIESVRNSSKLLFVSILCVSALHMKQNSNNHHLFPSLYREFIRLAAIQAFSRHQTLDDIRALVVGSFWLNDVSWTLVGTAVRIVTERHMHESYSHWVPSAPLLRRKRQNQSIPSGRSASDTTGRTPPNKNDSPMHIAYEEARLYYLIYIADHPSSIPYRRPPMTRQHEVVRRAVEWLNNCPWAENRSDTRLVALVKMWEILHDAIDEIGSDLHAPPDELGLAFHARFQGQIEAWYQTWSREFSVVDTYEKNDINRQRLYAELFLHSMAFRTDKNALPVFFPAQVTNEMMGESNSAVKHACFQADRRRVIAENAVDSAHRILELLGADMAHLDILTGSTSYSHTMTTFAIVLLVKALKQFGNEENPHHLRGADLRSVLRSIDPALRALVMGAQCVAKENMLVNITAGAKQSIEQIRVAYASLLPESHVPISQPHRRMEYYQRQPPLDPIPRLSTPRVIQAQNLPAWTPPIRTPPVNVQSSGAPNSEQQQQELGAINSLEGFDLLSGQIPLSGIDLFQDTTLGTGVDVSDLSSMFAAATSP